VSFKSREITSSNQATTVPIDDARLAIVIAEVLLREVFPTVITKFGLHLHDGFRACDSPKCSMT
jgi:hypothetical protein